ncbi:MAG: hypothetical protein HRU35_01390 [Rickettsiaceae bacterium]|nr:hypothetical protein [Rickettsiaceae bacterium]
MATTKENVEDNYIKKLDIPISAKPDIVDNQYKILLNKPVHDLGNEFCKYFVATNTQKNTEHLALIYENSCIPPIGILNTLSGKNIVGMVNILAYAIVTLSSNNNKCLAVIIEHYNHKQTLTNYIKDNKRLNIKQVEQLIKTLTLVLSRLNNDKIASIGINPDNIIILGDGTFILREFIHSYPNFYQKEQFIAPEIVECHPAARNSTIKGDIYAMAVTAFYTYTGREPWEEYPDNIRYNEARFEKTSYKLLTGDLKIPERMKLFLRSTLHDNVGLRWKISTIISWIEGKLEQSITHNLNANNQLHIAFNEKNYSNMQSLAYALFNNWNKVLPFLKDGKLAKWIAHQQINNDVVKNVQELCEGVTKSTLALKNSPESNRIISKLLSLIGHFGTIRYDGIAISATNVPQLLHYLLTNNKKVIFEKVIRIIQYEDLNNYTHPDAAGYVGEANINIYKNLITNLNSSSPFNGFERLVYSLNPYAKCYSRIVEKDYITDIQALLVSLDKIAEEDPKKFHIDRNMIAFIAAKLGIKNDINPIVLKNFPKFAEHPTVIALSIICTLQKKFNMKIPNIVVALALELKELCAEYIHNVKFKAEIISNLEKISSDNTVFDIVDVLSNQQKFINDYNGYYEACKMAQVYLEKIQKLRSSQKTDNRALIFGQNVTVLTSYVLCFIVAMILII